MKSASCGAVRWTLSNVNSNNKYNQQHSKFPLLRTLHYKKGPLLRPHSIGPKQSSSMYTPGLLLTAPVTGPGNGLIRDFTVYNLNDTQSYQPRLIYNNKYQPHTCK